MYATVYNAPADRLKRQLTSISIRIQAGEASTAISVPVEVIIQVIYRHSGGGRNPEYYHYHMASEGPWL